MSGDILLFNTYYFYKCLPVPVDKMTKFPNVMVLKVLVNGAGAMIILLDLPPELELEAGQPPLSTAGVLDDEELLEDPEEELDASLEELESDDPEEALDDPEDPLDESEAPLDESEEPLDESEEPLDEPAPAKGSEPALARGSEPAPARGSS